MRAMLKERAIPFAILMVIALSITSCSKDDNAERFPKTRSKLFEEHFKGDWFAIYTMETETAIAGMQLTSITTYETMRVHVSDNLIHLPDTIKAMQIDAFDGDTIASTYTTRVQSNLPLIFEKKRSVMLDVTDREKLFFDGEKRFEITRADAEEIHLISDVDTVQIGGNTETFVVRSFVFTKAKPQ